MNTQAVLSGKITYIKSDKVSIMSPLSVDAPYIITLSYDPGIVSPTGASTIYYSQYQDPSQSGPPNRPGFLLDVHFPFLSLPALTHKNMLGQDAPPQEGPYLEFNDGKLVGMNGFLWENVSGWPSLQAGDDWIRVEGTIFGQACEGSGRENWVQWKLDWAVFDAQVTVHVY